MDALRNSARLFLISAVIAASAVVGMNTSTAHAAPAAPAAPTQADENPCTAPLQGAPVGVDFRPACATHDACYDRGSTTNRVDCDNRLQADLRQACADAYKPPYAGSGSLYPECLSQADAFYFGVRQGGRGYYLGSGDPT